MAAKDKDSPRVGVRQFGEAVGEMAGGDVERALSIQLGELIRACDATKKKGKLTVTLNVAPGPKMMQISADIKATIPKPPIESQTFFCDDKGGLHLENPRQTKMPFEPSIVGASGGGAKPPEGEN